MPPPKPWQQARAEIDDKGQGRLRDGETITPALRALMVKRNGGMPIPAPRPSEMLD